MFVIIVLHEIMTPIVEISGECIGTDMSLRKIIEFDMNYESKFDAQETAYMAFTLE